MSASAQAIAALVDACEAATEAELTALGRALQSIRWDDDTSPGAALAVHLFRVPLAVAVEREVPDADLDAVLKLFEEMRNGG